MGTAFIFLGLLILGFLVQGIVALVFRQQITPKEWLLCLGASLASAIICCGFMALSAWKDVSDWEILNGEVVGKKNEKVHCRHSYSCNCVTVSCGKDCSTTICQTCYDHSFDIDWWVNSTIGKFDIDTIDRQGLKEPPRWTKAFIGEPVSRENWYKNYLLIPNNLIIVNREDLVEKYKDKIPGYPQTYDVYRANHVLTVDYALKDIQKWNDHLANLLKETGPGARANIVLVITSIPDPNYFYAIQTAWTGGKKNDIVVIISAEKDGTINWARSMSHSKDSMVTVSIDSDLEATKMLTMSVIDVVNKNVYAHYKKMEFEKDYEYLTENLKPSFGVIIFCFFFQLFCSIAIAILAVKHDLLDETQPNRFSINRYRY